MSGKDESLKHTYSTERGMSSWSIRVDHHLQPPTILCKWRTLDTLRANKPTSTAFVIVCGKREIPSVMERGRTYLLPAYVGILIVTQKSFSIEFC